VIEMFSLGEDSKPARHAVLSPRVYIPRLTNCMLRYDGVDIIMIYLAHVFLTSRQ
jgi:hypothetical protein